MYKILAKSIREYKKESILSPIFVILEVICESLMPFLVARLVKQIQTGADMNSILMDGLMMIGLALLALIFGSLAGRFAAIASTGFAKNVRKDMFYNVQNFSFENINKFSASSLVTRMTTDLANVQLSYMMLVRAVFRMPINFLFSFIMAYYMGGKMAYIFLFVAPLLAISIALIVNYAIPKFKAAFEKYDALNNNIQENIKGIRVVKSYVREKFENEKFQKLSGDLRDSFTRISRVITLNEPVFQISLNIVFGFVLAYGSYVSISTGGTELNPGQMSALLTYSFQILNSLMILSMVISMIIMSMASAKRIVEVLVEKPKIVNGKNPIYDVKDGSIEFIDVDFSYEKDRTDGKHDLTGINLEIKSGETIGIIGSTGSSKTTLIQLIPRLFDTTNGIVKVGGEDVKNYDLVTLRDEVAVVLQKNILFSGTIAENLRWGNKNATDEEIIEAAKLAQAHDFIMKFPKGYDTYIEQGGTNVSGGQKQRICIARALLKKPKILILDDSTSAVDTKTDALIRQGLKSYIPATTKIIIAQRFASVEDADKIIVLNKGKIDAIGSHAQLLEKSEVYREVYNTQNRKGEFDE